MESKTAIAQPGGDSRPPGSKFGRAGLIRLFVGILVTYFLFSVMLAHLEMDEAMARIGKADSGWCMAALGASFALFMLRSLRFWIFIPRVSFGVVAAATAIQSALLRVTPLRLGELSLPYTLKQEGGQPVAQILILLLRVRLVELWATLIVAFAAFVFTFGGQTTGLIVGLVAIPMGAVAVVGFEVWLKWLSRTVDWAAGVFGLKRFGKVSKLLAKFADAAAVEVKPNAIQLFVLGVSTLLIIACQMLIFFAVIKTYGLNADLLQTMVGSSLTLMGSMVPLAAVGNVGPFEAGWVVGFVAAGMPKADAVFSGIAAQVLTLGFAWCFALPSWIYLWLRRRGREGVKYS